VAKVSHSADIIAVFGLKRKPPVLLESADAVDEHG
jgi:hypothetical protein